VDHEIHCGHDERSIGKRGKSTEINRRHCHFQYIQCNSVNDERRESERDDDDRG